MLKRISILLTCFFSSFCFAEGLVLGAAIGFAGLEDDETDVDLKAIPLVIGYEVASENSFTFVPELRLGFGIGDDTADGIKYEIDTFTAIGVRGQFQANDNAYVFITPTWAKAKLKASAMGESGSGSEDDFGIQIGAGMEISDGLSAEISWESYDMAGTDIDMLNIGLRMAL